MVGTVRRASREAGVPSCERRWSPVPAPEPKTTPASRDRLLFRRVSGRVPTIPSVARFAAKKRARAGRSPRSEQAMERPPRRDSFLISQADVQPMSGRGGRGPRPGGPRDFQSRTPISRADLPFGLVVVEKLAQERRRSLASRADQEDAPARPDHEDRVPGRKADPADHANQGRGILRTVLASRDTDCPANGQDQRNAR